MLLAPEKDGMPSFSAAQSTAKAIVAQISEKNITFMAGSIAYNAFISLIPLLILLFFAVSVVGSGELETRLTELTMTYLTPAAGDAVGSALGDAENGGAGLSIVGFVALLWGTLKIFRGLDTAFAEIYESASETSVLTQLRDSLVVFAALCIAIVAVLGASVVFAAFESLFEATPALGLVNPLLLVLGLSVAFYPLYYVFPDVEQSFREVLPGVIVAAVGWAALQGLFQIYIAVSSASDTYGALAGVILLITWLYFGGLILLLGAVINATANGFVSDAPSGVGSTDKPDDERVVLDSTLDRESAATYLQELREDVTGRHEWMQPASSDHRHSPEHADEMAVRRPPADDLIEVSERRYLETGDPHSEVILRWRQNW